MKGKEKMKNRYLLSGLCCLIVGFISLIGIFFFTKFNFIFICLFIFGISGGCFLLWKFRYWLKPLNKDKAEQFLDNEQIEIQDERKVKLRNLAAKYTYILGLIVITLSIIVFSILRELEITVGVDIIIWYLTGYLFFQYFIGIIIYNYLNFKN